MDFPAFLGDLALRSTLLLVAALVVVRLLRRASAAERHLVLALAIIAALLLPAAILLTPKMAWRIPLPHQFTEKQVIAIPTTTAEAIPSALDSVTLSSTPFMPASALPTITLPEVLIAILTIGALFQLGLLLISARAWRRRRHSAVLVELAPEVTRQARTFAGSDKLPPILVSDSLDVPVLLGWRRPVILLPHSALEANPDCLAMMVCHELAHLRRRDAGLLPLLMLVRILYWWQPLAWLALARLRREREAACDDLVLAGAFRASDYADLIVDVARRLTSGPAIPSAVLAMATTSPLHERLNAILNPALRRRAPSRGILLLAVLITALAGFTLASTRIEADADKIATTAKPAPNQSPRRVRLDFRLMSVDEKVYQANKGKIDAMMLWPDGDIAAATQVIQSLPSGKLVQNLSVLADDGEKAIAENVRVFPYPTDFSEGKDGKLVPTEFKKRDLGLRIEATPQITADQKCVDTTLAYHVVTLDGWDSSWRGVRRPIFNANNLATKQLLKGDATSVFVFALQAPGRGDPYPLADGITAPPPNAPLKRLIVVTTAKILPPESTGLVLYHGQDVMVRTALRIFQISEKSYAAQPEAIEAALNRGDITFLSMIGDFNLLSEPAALSKPDEQATLEALHNIDPYPPSANGDGKRPGGPHQPRAVGFRVVEKASIVNTGIDLTLFPELTRFEGMIKTSSGEIQPVFNTRRISMKILMPDGGSHGIWLAKNIPDNAENRNGGEPDSTSLSSAPPVRVGMIVDVSLGVERSQGLFPLPNREKIIHQFNTILIPKFAMHQADLGDFLQAITIQTKNADPDHVGIAFVLNLSQPFPKVDLKFENASPKEIMDAVAKQTGLTYSIDDYAVYLRPSPARSSTLSIRTFLAPANLATEMKNGGAPAPGDGQVDAKAALSAHGIKFPPGASATLVTSSNKLTVLDTPEQLDALAKYIEDHPH